MGAYARKDAKAIAADKELALDRFPRLRERLTQSAGTLGNIRWRSHASRGTTWPIGKDRGGWNSGAA